MQVYRLDLPGEEGRCVEEQMVLLEPAALAGRVHGFSRTLRKGTQLSAHSLDAPRGEVALVASEQRSTPHHVAPHHANIYIPAWCVLRVVFSRCSFF